MNKEKILEVFYSCNIDGYKFDWYTFNKFLNSLPESEQCPEHINGYCGCQNDRPPLKETDKEITKRLFQTYHEERHLVPFEDSEDYAFIQWLEGRK